MAVEESTGYARNCEDDLVEVCTGSLGGESLVGDDYCMVRAMRSEKAVEESRGVHRWGGNWLDEYGSVLVRQ